jgi:hypothetical protein
MKLMTSYAMEEMMAKRPARELKNKKTLSGNPNRILYPMIVALLF